MKRPGLTLRLFSLCFAAAYSLALCVGAPAQDGIASGEAAWDKAGCLQCHGSRGEGGDGGEFPAGPSLRKTRLDRAALVEAISCGLPGTAMPVLNAAEIEALVDFLGARFIGH